MSSVMVKALVIVSLFIPAVWPSEDLWTLTCLPTAGIVSQTTLVNCNFKDIKDFKIVGVQLTKVNQGKPIFEIIKGTKSGDQRFSLENPEKGPSLQISDTVFSDEGEYLYRVITNRGEKTVPLYIRISAKYKNPITSTWPEDVIEGAPVDLYCNATDGYPAGFIHWFDRSGTNWTMNSHLTEDTKDINGFKYVALSSKLTFKTIDSQGMAPFTCIVLNSKYTKDGESTLTITSAFHSNQESSASNTIHIVAGVMVIGSLIVGLLCALLIFQKRNVQHGRRASAHPILSYEPPEPAEDDLEASNNSLNP